MPGRAWKIGNGGIAILLGLLTAVLLTATAPAIGLTWDEPAYIAASESYIRWVGWFFKSPAGSLNSGVIDHYWTINHEHPALDKVWSGAVWTLARRVLDDLTAHRLGNILLVGLLVGLLYFWIAEAYGKPAGLFAAAALMAMPRFFFHSHLAALDVPAAVSVFVVTFLCWRLLDRKGWAWGLLLGLAWGLALAMKINAIFVAPTVGLWLLVFRRHWRPVLQMALMGLVGVAIFFVLWPWLYPAPLERVWDYILFITTDHWKIGQWYFGRFYMPPPWHFSFVMLWAAVPLGTLLLGLLGGVRSGKGKKDGGLGWLLVLSALVPMVALATGKSMVYDNERLFMAAFPFLAALAGSGFGWLLEGLRRLADRWQRPDAVRRPVWFVAAAILLAALLLTSPVVTMARYFPHLLSYYSEGVGGLPGATRMGLETTYWCESYQATLAYINEHASPGDTVWAMPYSNDVLIYYQLHGSLRDDVTVLVPYESIQSILGPYVPPMAVGNYPSADWVIYQYRQTGIDEKLARWPKYHTPVYRLELDGVPIVDLYHYEK